MSSNNVDGFERAEQIAVQTPSPHVRKDNKLLAVVAMNIAAFSTTGMTATYRIIASDFHAAEFNLIRNICSLIAACIWCAV